MINLNTLFGSFPLAWYEVLGLFIFLHLLFDYALQGDFMAKAKNHVTPIPGVPPFLILFSHGFMQAFAIYAITRMPLLFVMELTLHIYTDALKSKGNISFLQDQAAHVWARVVYVTILLIEASP